MEKITAQSVVNALIERFDGIEDETGKDFSDSRRIILRWAKDKKIFKDNPYE